MAQLRATGQHRIDELPASSVFALRYRVARRIGTGGFGAVYEAEHVVTGRRCALKLLWPHLARDDAFRKRFLQEARLATQLQSEHIVDVLDAGIDSETDTPFLVMEYLDGEDLGSRAKRKLRFSPEETVIYLSQLAVGLDRTHAASIVHRDLKPENLFLTHWSDGSPLIKILDFGIAKLVAEQSMQGPTASAGTPLYMAPEQFHHGPATPAVDIYALGMIAFRFLVGRHYYSEERRQSENAYALLLRLSQGPAEPASERARRWGVELPGGFDGWFHQCTHHDHSQRFGSAIVAVLALARALGVQPREPLLTKQKPRLTGALTHGVRAMEAASVDSTRAMQPATVAPSVRANVTEAGTPPTQPYSARSPETPAETVSSSLLESAGRSLTATSNTSAAPVPARRTLPWVVAAIGISLALGLLALVAAISLRPAPKIASETRLRLGDEPRPRVATAARPIEAAPTADAPEPARPAPPATKSPQPAPASSTTATDLYSRE